MKKRIIALLCSMLTVTMLLFGCSTSEETVKKSKTIQSKTTSGGRYYLFTTISQQEYLNFLENFDETKYEIVDISISQYAKFAVTYKAVSK